MASKSRVRRRDAFFSRADQERFMAALPAARLKVHDETGHCSNGERPAWHAALSSWRLISPPLS
jgi:hypothetical protein